VLVVQDHLPDAGLASEGDGTDVRARGVRSILSPAPAAVELGALHASSYEGALRAVRRTVAVPASGHVRWTIRAVRAGAAVPSS
jgi:hypothetical protein